MGNWASITKENKSGINNRTLQTIPEIRDLLRLDPFSSDIGEISNRISLSENKENERLFVLCKSYSSDKTLMKDTSTRIAVVKILLALLPKSTRVVRQLLSRKEDKHDFEMHFTLFCFLDDVPELLGEDDFTHEIPMIIEKYMMETKRETAKAMFMAGDLLGDHWDIKEAIPILIKVSKEAKYSVGRENAVHGLGHILLRLSKSDKYKTSIISLLKSLSEKDRSKEVRATAQLMLKLYSRSITT